MNQKNEFQRDRPRKKNGFGFSLFHKLFPLFIAVTATWYSAQVCASLFNYDPVYVGYPWFVFGDVHPVYYPYLLPVLIIKYIGTSNPSAERIIFYSSLYMAVGVFLGVVLYFILSWTRNIFNREQQIHGTARLGTKKDLQKNGLLADRGVVLGQLDKAVVDYSIKGRDVLFRVRKTAQLVQHMMRASTILFGPTRMGKGISSIVTTLLNFPGSIITIDPKGENYEITGGYRSQFSYVWKHSPVSHETLRFNILDEISGESPFRDASMIADILVTPSDGKIDGSSKHWIDTARDLLTGAILHVKCSSYPDKSLYGVLSFLSRAVVNSASDDRGASLLDSMINSPHCSSDIHEIVANVARRNLARPDEERGSVFSTAVTALQIFEDPFVKYATSASDFCLNDFTALENPISLYITCPFSDLDRLSTYMRLVITFILRKFSQGETSHDTQKLTNPILILIDEFPTLGYFPALETMMGILAGYGITFFLVCQTPNQLFKLYGQDTAILDHCRYVATYNMTDIKSAEMFSKMMGVEGVTHSNMSTSGSRYDFGMNNLNVSEQSIQRNVMNADELVHLPANRVVVFGQGMPATICKKVAYYDDPRFKAKAHRPVPATRKELLVECLDSVKPDVNSVQWNDLPESVFLPSYDMEVVPEMKANIVDLATTRSMDAAARGATI